MWLTARTVFRSSCFLSEQNRPCWTAERSGDCVCVFGEPGLELRGVSFGLHAGKLVLGVTDLLFLFGLFCLVYGTNASSERRSLYGLIAHGREEVFEIDSAKQIVLGA